MLRKIRIAGFTCAAFLAYVVLSQMFRQAPAPARDDTAELSQEPESPVDLPLPSVPPPPPPPKPAADHNSRKAPERQKSGEPVAARDLILEPRSELSSLSSAAAAAEVVPTVQENKKP